MTAHKRAVVNNKYIEGWLNDDGSITPSKDRVCVIPDPPKVFNEYGLEIPEEHRVIPSQGVVESVGALVKHIKSGDRVYYEHRRGTVVSIADKITSTGSTRILFRQEEIPFTIDNE